MSCIEIDFVIYWHNLNILCYWFSFHKLCEPLVNSHRGQVSHRHQITEACFKIRHAGRTFRCSTLSVLSSKKCGVYITHNQKTSAHLSSTIAFSQPPRMFLCSCSFNLARSMYEFEYVDTDVLEFCIAHFSRWLCTSFLVGKRTSCSYIQGLSTAHTRRIAVHRSVGEC